MSQHFSFISNYSTLFFVTAQVNYDNLNLHPLKFNPDNDSLTDVVSIQPVLGDTMLEVDEEFILSLSLLQELNERVAFEPHNATIIVFEINGEGKATQN